MLQHIYTYQNFKMRSKFKQVAMYLDITMDTAYCKLLSEHLVNLDNSIDKYTSTSNFHYCIRTNVGRL